jgi:hypothetical protein
VRSRGDRKNRGVFRGRTHNSARGLVETVFDPPFLAGKRTECVKLAAKIKLLDGETGATEFQRIDCRKLSIRSGRPLIARK